LAANITFDHSRATTFEEVTIKRTVFSINYTQYELMKRINMQISSIVLRQIDFDDQSYNLRPEGDIDLPKDFLDSINKCGVLSPPIVLDVDGGGYIILAGRKRLIAARDILKLNCFNCFVVAADASPAECLEVVLEEGLLSSSWSPVMKAKYLHKVVEIMGSKEVISKVLPRLGITPQKFHLEKALALADLEEPFVMAIHQGHIAEKTAYELSRLPFRDRLTLLDLINGLKLSVGNQRQIITICNDLAKRASTSIHAVLNEADIMEVLNQKKQNIPQQTAKLMKVLQNRRFPHLNDANQEFSSWQNSLNLPRKADISHTPAFETDQVTLHLNFVNQEKLADFCREFVN
jgi:ParB family chromosome partitioning protein